MKTFQIAPAVLKKEQLGPSIYRLTFSAHDIAEMSNPGQFVMLQATQGFDPLLRRPFSIHHITDTEPKTLQILFKVVGKGTEYLASLKVGDRIDMIGPLGNIFNIDAPGGHCLVGGGMGIAPMLYLAKVISKLERTKSLKIILGAQNKKEIEPLLANFEELGVDVLHTTDDGSSGHHGFVTDLLEPSLNSDIEKIWNIHCCGPHPMMKQVAKISEKKNWNCWVSMETMMACGIGACLGCTVESPNPLRKQGQNYLHVCKDGPVFRATDIKW